MPALQLLGQGHAAFGVHDEHDLNAGAALLKAIYQGLGVAYNAKVEETRFGVYGVLAAKMKQAAAVPA